MREVLSEKQMRSKATIRRITAHEHVHATHVWKTSWESAGVGHPNDLSFEQLLEKFKRELHANWDFFVADRDGQIVGLLALKPDTNQLDQLFIAPEQQGRGMGLQLLDFAKQTLPNGMWLRTAELNKRAIQFYSSAGFSIDRVERRPEWDRNDIVMSWQP